MFIVYVHTFMTLYNVLNTFCNHTTDLNGPTYWYLVSVSVLFTPSYSLVRVVIQHRQHYTGLYQSTACVAPPGVRRRSRCGYGHDKARRQAV